MTDDAGAARTARLVATRRKAADDKRAHALAVIEALLSRGERVSFVEVQRAAGVSTWFVYNNLAVRAAIEHAMRDQLAQHADGRRTHADDRTMAGLRTELANAKAEIRALRDERDRLRHRLQRGLGDYVAAISQTELIDRLRAIEHENQQLQSTLRSTSDDLGAARRERESALADRDGAQLALRQMMRGVPSA